MTKIYVSSTYSDLVKHRQQVYDVLRKMRYDVIAMEDYVATDKRPLDKCLADVASCHIYVGIFAWRYGYVPPGQERSITELEYRQASKCGLEHLIFLLDEDAPWPRSKMESGVGGEKIEALRAGLAREHTVQFFESSEELAGQVAASVAEWAQARLDADMDSLRVRRDQADRERREMRDRQRVVNVRPLDVAHFKDRLREIQALCDHLADSSVRLVSVVGRGGMGKTALVSKVLADLEHGIKTSEVSETSEVWQVDGILYLSARSTGLGLERIYIDVGRMLGEPAASKLAARWAARDASLKSKVEYLLETMRDGLYFILLDGLEDELTEDGAIAEEGLRLFVERCLIQPGGARLVVTSREEVRLAAAALHGARSIPLREGLPEDEAVALLRELDPQGTLGLCDAPEGDLRRAARLTRGIPRALEILAGILHEDPTASLPKLLADEAKFGAEVVERLVAAGYRRLGDDERRIMEVLAVFDRPVDETAIAYLLHPWFPGLDVRAGLRRLVSGYFVSASRITEEYSLHPLDHDYAYRQILDEMGRGEKYTRRNLELRAADFYAGLRKPESEWETTADLRPQLYEFDHLVKAGDYDQAALLLDSIEATLSRWGHFNRLIEMRQTLLGKIPDQALEEINLGSMGVALHEVAQGNRATACFQKALKLARKAGSRQREARWLGHLGKNYRHQGFFEEAIRCSQQALKIASDISDQQLKGVILEDLGVAYRELVQHEYSITCLKEALDIARESGDGARENQALGNLGVSYSQLGQHKNAIRYLREAIEVARKAGDERGKCIWLINLGATYLDMAEYNKAIYYCQQALPIAYNIGTRGDEGNLLAVIGRAYLAQKEYGSALEKLSAAAEIADECKISILQHASMLAMAKIYLYQDELNEALQTIVLARQYDSPRRNHQSAALHGWHSLKLG
ncbi:MAG: tetratricopeptide repeat protein [Anaerolineales bacterium]|nr:MAG: tetratricopeptide repeat protein [Anaerolineales bacterium]